MKAISKRADAVLRDLIEGMTECGQYCDIDNAPEVFMAVHVECITVVDLGWIYSVGHYSEQNGDLMADPEIVFLVTKNQGSYPIEVRMDYAGVRRESVFFDGGKIKSFAPNVQADQVKFANLLLGNIKKQQGLKIKKSA